MFYCEKDEAFVVDVEKDSMVYISALVADFKPPDFSLAGYVFDLWMVPGFSKVVGSEFFYGLSYCSLSFVFQFLVVEAELFFKDCLR